MNRQEDFAQERALMLLEIAMESLKDANSNLFVDEITFLEEIIDDLKSIDG